MADHGIGLAQALLGLDGFRVLGVAEADDETVVRVETTGGVAACPECGGRTARLADLNSSSRDREAGDRPGALVFPSQLVEANPV
jgi:hypothetical protein